MVNKEKESMLKGIKVKKITIKVITKTPSHVVRASSYVRLALLMYVSGPHAPVVLVRQWFQNKSKSTRTQHP